MSVGGPSPLGTLMVQRVEAALGVTLAQQANLATGARPDAVTQPSQPDKVDPAKNPPPKEHEGSRRAPEKGTRQSALAALSRNNPEIAKLLAARNAPMTSFTASAPTSLGPAAKAILVLLQQFPDIRPAITGRAPLLAQSPGQGGSAARAAGVAGGQGYLAGGAPSAAGGTTAQAAGTLDPNAVEALAQRGEGSGNAAGGQGNAAAGASGSGAAATGQAQAGAAGQAGGAATASTGAATAGQGTPSAAAGNMASAATGASGAQLPSPTGMAGQLAHALSSAIQSSGLFYESHLRDLAFGLRNVAELRAEPQAQAGLASGDSAQSAVQAQARGEAGASGSAGQAGDAQGAGRQAAPHAAGSQAAAAYAASAQAGYASAQLAGALLGLDPSTHMLVRQQLEALANQALIWQGEAWPGAEMEWEVQRREPREGEPDQTESWATRLKLQLPGMGDVEARLSLSGSQLILHLASPQGADLMADHTDMLRQRLGLQGLTLSQLTISRESGTDEGKQP